MRIEFLMGASPTDAFWSQAAMFRLQLNSLGEPFRSARQVVTIHRTDMPHEVPSRWAPWFENIDVWWSDGQDRSVFQAADPSCDVSIACDADTLLLRALPADFLVDCCQRPAVRAVIAHYPPPLEQRARSSNATLKSHDELWSSLSARILGRPLTAPYRYTLMEGGEERCPFYVNHGFIAAPSTMLVELGRGVVDVLPEIEAILDNQFRYQLAIPFAIERAMLPREALPMRFNFPNDPVCDRMYPDELSHVLLMHYLRTTVFDRHRIFVDQSEFQRFLALPMAGSNAVFRDAIHGLTAGHFPFLR